MNLKPSNLKPGPRTVAALLLVGAVFLALPSASIQAEPLGDLDVELQVQGPVETGDAIVGVAAGTIAAAFLIGTLATDYMNLDLLNQVEDNQDELQNATWQLLTGQTLATNEQLRANQETTLAMANNRLQDSRTILLAKVKQVVMDDLAKGKSRSTIEADVETVVDQHYAAIQHNLYVDYSGAVATVGNLEKAKRVKMLNESGDWNGDAPGATRDFYSLQVAYSDVPIARAYYRESTGESYGDGDWPVRGYYLKNYTRETTLLDGSHMEVQDLKVTGGDPASPGYQRFWVKDQRESYTWVTQWIRPDPVLYLDEVDRPYYRFGDARYGDRQYRGRGGSFDSVETLQIDMYKDVGTPEHPLYRHEPVLRTREWGEVFRDLKQQHSSAKRDSVDLANDMVTAYNNGELNVTDVADPYVMLQQSQRYNETGWWGYRAAPLYMMGVNSSGINATMVVELPERDPGNDTLYGGLFTDHGFGETNGSIETGYLYNPVAWQEAVYVVTQDGTTQVTEPFRVVEAYTADGESLTRITPRRTNYQTANVSALEDQIAAYQDLVDKYQELADNPPTGGGTGGTGGTGEVTWVLVGAVAAMGAVIYLRRPR